MQDRTGRLGLTPRAMVVAVLLAVTGTMLTACGNDEEQDRLEIGSVVTARSAIDPDERKTRVLLPSGKLVLRTGEPLTELEADQTSDHLPMSAPEGGSFVPLRWTFYTDLFSGVHELYGAPRTTSLALVADGERYGLPAPRRDAVDKSVSNMYVAVKGDPESLVLEVEHAGVTQKADLETGEVKKGRARLLDRASAFKVDETTKCDSARWLYISDETVVTFACTHTKAMLTPYLDGKFAKKGYAFVAMNISSNLANFLLHGPGGRALFHAKSSSDSSTLDGRKPIKRMGMQTAAGAAEGYLVWRVELDDKGEPRVPDVVHFARDYELELNSLSGSFEPAKKRKVTIEGDIPFEIASPKS